MFEKVVISDAGSDRRWYFLFSTAALSIGLVAALIFSLFSATLSLDTGDLELVRLLSPVRPPDIEPPPPPEPEPQQDVVKQPTTVKAPTRQVNMARVDESPRTPPNKVSTVRNTQKARPANRYFKIGKIDSDPVGGYTSDRPSDTAGSSSGAGTGLSTGSETARVTETKPPPPPVRKPPEAPKPVAKKPVTRSLGVINGKATSLPKPRYPATTRAVNAEGRVNVKVLIDEAGRVISANAISGHPLLRNPAEAAARMARFTPTRLSGEAVRVSGIITYNFQS